MPDVFRHALCRNAERFYSKWKRTLTGRCESCRPGQALRRKIRSLRSRIQPPARRHYRIPAHGAHAASEEARDRTGSGGKEAPPPTPEEQAAADAAAGEPAADGQPSAGGTATAPARMMFAMPVDRRTGRRREAIAQVAACAAFLRSKGAFSPAPYLMMRGLRWGELRASSDPRFWKRLRATSGSRSRPSPSE